MPRQEHRPVSLRVADYEDAREMRHEYRLSYTVLIALALRVLRYEVDECEDKAAGVAALLEKHGLD